MTQSSIPAAAVEYVAHGWRLVPLGADKRPVRAGWNTFARTVGEVEEAAGLRCAGVGLAHAYSGTVAIDVDDPEASAAWLLARGVNLSALRAAPDAVVIESPSPGRFKLLYRHPAGDRLTTVLPVKGLELRHAARSGATMQDVLPPSPHPKGGEYRWSGGGRWENLPPLPQALLDAWVHQIGAPAPVGELPADYPEPLGLTDDEIRAVLARIDPDVTYPEWIKIGQALQHERPDDGYAFWHEWSAKGSKYAGPELMQGKWEGFGHAAKPATMRGIVRDYASTATVDEFDVVEDEREIDMAALGLVPMGDFRYGPMLKWLIRDLLPAATLGVIYGPPGSGKSFIAMDLMAAIARGQPWLGRRVRRGRVVYIAAEGEAGLRKRADAYMRENQLTANDVRDFLFYPGVVNLLKDDWKPFAKIVQNAGGADVIVVDTLAQSMAGGDENTSEDMGKVIRAAQELHKATGAMVLLIHHSGKDVERGARGWSGLKGAVDVEFSTMRDDESKIHFLRVAKQKDGETGLEFPFRLRSVELDPDEDGPRYSCTVEHMDPADANKESSLSPRLRLVMEVVAECSDLADDTAPVPLVLTTAAKRMTHDPLKKDTRRDDARRALNDLAARGRIIVMDNHVRIA